MSAFGRSAPHRWRSLCAPMTKAASAWSGWKETPSLGRLMQHVLPTGIKRIRHYGVLASACKGAKLGAARAALQMPVPQKQAQESTLEFMARVARRDVQQCPCCKQGAAALCGHAAGSAPPCAAGAVAGIARQSRAAMSGVGGANRKPDSRHKGGAGGGALACQTDLLSRAQMASHWGAFKAAGGTMAQKKLLPIHQGRQ